MEQLSPAETALAQQLGINEENFDEKIAEICSDKKNVATTIIDAAYRLPDASREDLLDGGRVAQLLVNYYKEIRESMSPTEWEEWQREEDENFWNSPETSPNASTAPTRIR